MPRNSVDLAREGFGTSSWRLVEIDVGREPIHSSFEAFGNTRFGLWLLAPVFSLLLSRRSVEQAVPVLPNAASVVVNFEVRLRVSKSALKVVPAKASTPDWVKAVTTFESAFLHQRGPVHFHVFRGHFALGDGVFFISCSMSSWTPGTL